MLRRHDLEVQNVTLVQDVAQCLVGKRLLQDALGEDDAIGHGDRRESVADGLGLDVGRGLYRSQY